MGFMFQCFPEFCRSSDLKSSKYFDFFSVTNSYLFSDFLCHSDTAFFPLPASPPQNKKSVMKVNLMFFWAWGPWRQVERIYIPDRAHVEGNVTIMEH